MKEYKVKYSHAKAKEIISNIGAVFAGKVEQKDFYLKTKNGIIYKLQKEDGGIRLVNLNQEEGGFVLNISEYLSEEVHDILLPLFENNPLVLKKDREFYTWKGSKIALDKVEKFGEFLELHPVDENAQNELFEAFGITSKDLITKSYFEL